jgi:phage shock protein PspC (stress-responsive transcriptional regulator)
VKSTQEVGMTLSDELNRLHELHGRGGLSDEEYARAKEKVLGGAGGAGPGGPATTPALAALGRLRRSVGDRWLAGVCGGLGIATGVESWVWRLVFAALLLWGGVGLIVYLLLWIFVPAE